MVLLDQIKYELGQYKEPMEDLGRALAREEKDARIAEIGTELSDLQRAVGFKNKCIFDERDEES